MKNSDKEYIGDAILEYLARDYITEYYPNHKNRSNVITNLTANISLTIIGKRVGIKPCVQPHRHHAACKCIANQVEVLIYDKFIELGLEQLKVWFVDEIVYNSNL